MWREMTDPGGVDETISEVRRSKRMKLYADEDIEEEAVAFLRTRGVNIKTARELGNRGKPDSYQAATAFRMKRFLLTKNGKDFWDDRILPFNNIHGLIAVEGSMNAWNKYARVLFYVSELLVPAADPFEDCKIWVTSSVTTIKQREGGQTVTPKYKYEGGKLYE